MEFPDVSENPEDALETPDLYIKGYASPLTGIRRLYKLIRSPVRTITIFPEAGDPEVFEVNPLIERAKKGAGLRELLLSLRQPQRRNPQVK